MPSSLVDPYLKTARAKEHLDDLEERLRLFRESQPCKQKREDHTEQGRHTIQFDIKPIPDKIPLIVGDFAYCLRSSLDQLVWALAKEVGSYPKGTQFPILEKPNEVTFRQCTELISRNAAEIIESLQPYHDRDGAKNNLLWRLNKLCNIDKHRRVPTDAAASDYNFPQFPRKFRHLISFDNETGVVSVPLELKEYMTVDPIFNLNVFFGDSFEELRCDFADLERMYAFVANSLIPRFSRFFSA